MNCVKKLFLAFLVPSLSILLMSADTNFPEAKISNGVIHAKLYLPDAEHGYYQGVRFDWAGVIPSLEYAGHNFFGKWFEQYDPKIHDAIMGPVEEFRSEDGGLGYAEAKPGETFVKIGVGVLRKPDDKPYDFSRYYDLVSGGKWSVKPHSDQVVFTQELKDSAYAYFYSKTVQLAKGKPELVLEHELKNIGSKVIDTSVYNHDFYMLDSQPASPDYTVKFAFSPHAENDLKGLAVIDGKDLSYTKELEKGQSVGTYITGFGDSAKDNDIVVENKKAGTGVRETGDQPLSKLYFWSILTTVCPEAYIHMHIEPGQTFRWKITYHFYTLAKPAQS